MKKIPGLVFVFFLIGFTAPLPAQSPGGTGLQTASQNYQAGRDLELRGRLPEAEPYYNTAIRLCQDEISRNAADRDTYTVMTWTLRRLNRNAEVITWGERGLALFSDEYRIVETMGEAYFYLDNYNRSLSSMQRFVNAVPRGERTPVAYFFIGEIYRLTGRYRHADIAYTTAVRLESGVALWWFRLATVRESAGEKTPAIEAYQQAVRLNPSYREANEGLARLEGR